MISVRDICALVFAALLVGAVLGTGYMMLERHYSARDMTDMSSSHRRSGW